MKLSAYILAGGKSSRMGTDKGLLQYNNAPFVKHIWNTLQSITPTVFVITSNKAYHNYNLNCIEDVFPNQGPVGGIYTALQHSENEHLIIISCDAPLVSSLFLKWLINEHQKANATVTFPSLKGKDYPLIGMYSKSLETYFQQALQNNHLKLSDVIKQHPCAIIAVPSEFEKNLYNINTPEEYQKLLEDEHCN